MIATSIMMSRALAPLELAIANWKGFVSARQSWARLKQLLELLADEQITVELPPRLFRRWQWKALVSRRQAFASWWFAMPVLL